MVTVELLKTPVDEDISTVVTGRLISNPIENELAIGNDPISDSSPYINKSFSTDSWEAISYAIRNNQLSKYKVGDTRKIIIDDKEYTLRIANITTPEECNDESYSETACGFVVEFVDIVNLMPMKSSKTTGGYTTSGITDYLNGEFYSKLPEDLKNIIIDTRVVSGHEENVANDYTQYNQKLYLLSATEIFGPEKNPYDSARNKTFQLDYYKTSGTEIITKSVCGCGGCTTYTYTVIAGSVKKYNESNTNYWLRNASNNSETYFSYVDYYANIDNTGYSSNLVVVPAFRIK